MSENGVRSDAAWEASDTQAAASPRDRAAAALERFFKDNSREQTLSLWQNYARLSPANAQETLAAFDAVIADPPEDLREFLLEHGWVNLFHDNGGDPVIYTQEEHIQWLHETAAQLRASL